MMQHRGTMGHGQVWLGRIRVVCRAWKGWNGMSLGRTRQM